MAPSVDAAWKVGRLILSLEERESINYSTKNSKIPIPQVSITSPRCVVCVIYSGFHSGRQMRRTAPSQAPAYKSNRPSICSMCFMFHSLDLSKVRPKWMSSGFFLLFHSSRRFLLYLFFIYAMQTPKFIYLLLLFSGGAMKMREITGKYAEKCMGNAAEIYNVGLQRP